NIREEEEDGHNHQDVHLRRLNLYFFFFSSRSRHTRWPRDWSSDVCSSDLSVPAETGGPAGRDSVRERLTCARPQVYEARRQQFGDRKSVRVGKECRSWGSPSS